MRSQGLLIAVMLGIATTGCNSSDSAAHAGAQQPDCENLVPGGNWTDTVLSSAKLALSSAAERDSAALSNLVTNDTLVRKMLRRDKQLYRAAYRHVQKFCVVSASHHRVEIDIHFPYSGRAIGGGEHLEHYQMVFVPGRNGWLLDQDILWSRM